MSKKVNFGKKEDISVFAFLDISDSENPRILTLEEELKLDKGSLPENVIKITSVWKRSNYMYQQLVEANSFSEKVIGNRIQRSFDPNAMMQAQIRCLLAGWNLHDYDPDFVLNFEASPDNPKIMILTNTTMQKIGEITPPEIISELHSRMLMASISKNQKPMETELNKV